MNKVNGNNQDSYRELLLMSELEDVAPISQREIAGRLGIALGLVNAFVITHIFFSVLCFLFIFEKPELRIKDEFLSLLNFAPSYLS